MRTACILIVLLTNLSGPAQDIGSKIGAELVKLKADSQFHHAIISLYVADESGKVVYGNNENVGLAPASCQKIVTSASAFELLGKAYRYKTQLWYEGIVDNGTLHGAIHVKGSGDPSLGSWRFTELKGRDFFNTVFQFLDKAHIKKIHGKPVLRTRDFSTQVIPDGWIWQDIGNYYGAGAGSLNWHENQYDILLNPGTTVGAPAIVNEIVPAYTGLTFYNECTTGPRNSGDNAYIYLPLGETKGSIRGTVPLGEKRFSISGAVYDPAMFFTNAWMHLLKSKGYLESRENTKSQHGSSTPVSVTEYVSPSFDSLNYWFLKKSINLYGEAFIKTISYEKDRFGSTDSGIKIIRNFWSAKGLDRSALKIIDGSGLSPANRITTSALVSILQYAKKRPWFSSFYNSLPEINGIRMKDGYISGVRSYAGYIKNRSGFEYTFGFIVNNFDGSATRVREKMWKLLDVLK